jgi:hypothetical protein
VDSWKKKGVEEGEEVTSPEKRSSGGVKLGSSVGRKNLLFGQGTKGDGGEEVKGSGEDQSVLVQVEDGKGTDVNSAMQFEQHANKARGSREQRRSAWGVGR